MSARSPRRQFASPFVVTLALTTAAAGGTVDARPTPPTQQTVAPLPSDQAPSPSADAATSSGQANRPASPKHWNPPKPPSAEDSEAASEKTQWHVEKSGDECTARRIVEHRACPPGASCNPPKPLSYKCPKGVTPPFEITQPKGETTCYVMSDRVHCAPGDSCNPPPPRRVPCP